jgi:hypothetical protein
MVFEMRDIHIKIILDSSLMLKILFVAFSDDYLPMPVIRLINPLSWVYVLLGSIAMILWCGIPCTIEEIKSVFSTAVWI